ncbi:MAG TPA: sigma-70 family RNA polymerase sigma factor, partial [Acetobacteraceae bacterium]|nr:sigma-70 family RNA polymerase sigma factor [Acetobacteraceae bacterium]
LVRLLGAAERFEPGTNFKAWAFTILRNRFLNEYVAKRRRTQPLHEMDADFAAVLPRQSDRLELRDLSRVFMRLGPEHRSILSLTLGARLSYGDVARIHGCAVGTVKSRVYRARLALARLLEQAYDPEATPALRGTEARVQDGASEGSEAAHAGHAQGGLAVAGQPATPRRAHGSVGRPRG